LFSWDKITFHSFVAHRPKYMKKNSVTGVASIAQGKITFTLPSIE
jgi:hypothetical protein